MIDTKDSLRIWVERAYKKLKGDVYFDKTALPLLEQIGEFESKGLEPSLNNIVYALQADDNAWNQFKEKVLDTIKVLIFPKKLQETKNSVFINNQDQNLSVDEYQFMINMDVNGHILGVLWILAIGRYLDTCNECNAMYEHSYGNRLRKGIMSGDYPSATPYLFEPYFSQYKNWRDNAISYAQSRLDSKQDALILMLDFKRFYYSVDIRREKYDDILLRCNSKKEWIHRLHEFIYQVLCCYSEKLYKIQNKITNGNLLEKGNVCLPIGFLPSNILGNWFLSKFDDAVIERINPVYYGRYVDDIIIVDKLEKNSPLKKKIISGAKNEGCGLSENDVIEYYSNLCSLSLDNNPYSLFVKTKDDAGENEISYKLNPLLFYKNNKYKTSVNISFQNSKVKVFYFMEGSTRALLDCFKHELIVNSSEFRFMPDMDKILKNNDYSEIFRLYNTDSPNKLRGISEFGIDRYAFSKFLGKYRKAGTLITDDSDKKFIDYLMTLLDNRVLISNYLLWERLMEIMIVYNQIHSYKKLVKKILQAIKAFEKINFMNHDFTSSLLDVFHAACCRTLALCSGDQVKTIILNSISPNQYVNYETSCINIRQSYMVNKYIMPLHPFYLSEEKIQQYPLNLNLCNVKDFLSVAEFKHKNFRNGYYYFPYMITPQEISFAHITECLTLGINIPASEEQIKYIKAKYKLLNFSDDKLNDFTEIQAIDNLLFDNDSNVNNSVIEINSDVLSNEKLQPKIKVAIGNARLNLSDTTKALQGHPNRSLNRYQQVVELISQAIKEKVDMLILPECFMPYEWIPEITRRCAQNQMALITGIEHVCFNVKERKVYNLTACILPYRKGEYKYAHVVYHHKVHYSPTEKETITGNGLEPFEGNYYQLIHWHDVWFSVYCCFELASIKDRSLFNCFNDMVVAVEWNKDVNYFSSIVESLSRDMHCYCVQVNSSDYGDSRIVYPASTEMRDLIKTKGGINYTLMTDYIDFGDLRDFQRLGYTLQEKDKTFKPTPPAFNPIIPTKKQEGSLLQYLLETNKKINYSVSM